MIPFRQRTGLPVLLLSLALGGCGGADQPPFPELSPVKGVVKRGNDPVAGGDIKFTPEPDRPEFIVNSVVGADGTYSLTTVRTTDTRGERKPGAPAGNYKVTYIPPHNSKTSTKSFTPIDLKALVTVQAGANDIAIDLSAAK